MKTLGVSLVKEKLRMYLDALRNEYAAQLILLPNDTKSNGKPSAAANSVKSKMEKLAVNDAMKEPAKVPVSNFLFWAVFVISLIRLKTAEVNWSRAVGSGIDHLISCQCGIKISTKKVKMTETFMTTIEELFLTLTQKERVSAWARSEVKESAAVGSTMVLFDKNIEGNSGYQ